jgi:hypothetical protein
VTDLFTNPQRYGDLDAWRREAVELHARGPIHRIEQPGYQPFWAVIGHDAVLDIERRPDDFTNAPVPILGSDEQLSMRARAAPRSARSSIWTSPITPSTASSPTTGSSPRASAA